MNIGGIFNDNLSLLSSATPGDVRITPYRALHVNLRTNAGAELGTVSNPIPVNVVSGGGSGNAAAGLTGAAVPTSADYIGIKIGGNLVGVGDTQALPISGTVTANSTLQAGSAIVGKVGIDQTTPGTTNGVQINAALPAGTNSIGTVVQTALVNGSISNNASVSTTASTFTAPANAVGFILEAESGNTDNIRWAVGATATSSVGNLYEPGRDTGYIPMAANISVIAISGTQAISVQWVLR